MQADHVAYACAEAPSDAIGFGRRRQHRRYGSRTTRFVKHTAATLYTNYTAWTSPTLAHLAENAERFKYRLRGLTNYLFWS